MHACELETLVPGGTSRRSRRSGKKARGTGKSTATAAVARTWLKSVDGRINCVTINKLDEAWAGSFMMNAEDEDWEATMKKLEQNLKANSLRLVNVGGMMRVVPEDE